MFFILVKVAGECAVDDDFFVARWGVHESWPSLFVFDDNADMRAVTAVMGASDANDVTVL